jgi:hypothetical protein
VTDSVEFDPVVNNPPTFVKRPGSKLAFPGEIKFVKRSDAASWSFPLRVRDADRDQDLELHSRIVTSMNRDPDRAETRLLPATGSLTRDFEYVINSGELLTDNCHRIDLVVSGSFNHPLEGDEEDLQDFEGRTDPDDFASYTFWIWEGEPDSFDAQKIVETCKIEAYKQPTATMGTAGESVR